MFEIGVPTPNSWGDRCPLMTRSAWSCLLSLLHRSPLFLFLTFVSCHAGIFSSFALSLSTAAFASGIFIARGIGKMSAQYCSGSMIWFLFLQLGLRDLCVEILPSAFSSAATMHAYFVLGASELRQVSLYVLSLILQGIVLASKLPTFLGAFLMHNSLKMSVRHTKRSPSCDPPPCPSKLHTEALASALCHT